ncbi:MAG: metal-dependent hydrolase [Fusobacteria bacterium]|nr:metal-dependent hydrolase [Fusobacteriota bacterium]
MNYTFLGHNVNLFEFNGKKIITDPWVLGNPIVSKQVNAEELDYILLTHGHFDHIGNTVEFAKANPKIKIISNPEIGAYLQKEGVAQEQLASQYIGGYVSYDGFEIKGVLAVHGSSLPDGSYGGIAMGFILNAEGKKIYISGDTGLTLEMQLLKDEDIDLAIMPMGGQFTMDLCDFKRAMKMVGAKKNIPVHYNTFPVIACSDQTLQESLGKCGGVYIIQINETIKV